ncbi:MAG: ABC transporter permease [Suipraeoptans sp.]
MQLIKYRFIQMSRDRTTMFWSVIWPMILASLFFLAFSNMSNDSTRDGNWSDIPVAYITEETSPNTEAFESFLKEMDGDMIILTEYSSDSTAIEAMENGDITGIFHVSDEPYLTVSKSGLNESILTSLLETYNINASLIMDVAENNPERLSSVIEEMNEYSDYTQDKSLGGNSLNPISIYFFTLIAYACLSGAYLGTQSSFDSQANLSPLAARRSITPTSKLKLILVDFLVIFTLHFINMLVLTAYLIFILKIDLGNNIPALLLIEFMGTIIGVSIGIMIGSLAKVTASAKIGITITFTLFPSFLAGLMISSMKNIIEQNAPIINRINPAAVLSDAIYYLSVFNNTPAMIKCLIILGIMSIVFITIAFIGVRREQYDSI